jgi:ABC-type branched-subunit amino acid transport system ATPase component
MIEHIMQLIMNLCNRLVCIQFGTKIAEGPTEEVAGDPKVTKAYLGDAEEPWAWPRRPTTGISQGRMLLEVKNLNAGYGFLQILRQLTCRTWTRANTSAWWVPTGPARAPP